MDDRKRLTPEEVMGHIRDFGEQTPSSSETDAASDNTPSDASGLVVEKDGRMHFGPIPVTRGQTSTAPAAPDPAKPVAPAAETARKTEQEDRWHAIPIRRAVPSSALRNETDDEATRLKDVARPAPSPKSDVSADQAVPNAPRREIAPVRHIEQKKPLTDEAPTRETPVVRADTFNGIPVRRAVPTEALRETAPVKPAEPKKPFADDAPTREAPVVRENTFNGIPVNRAVPTEALRETAPVKPAEPKKPFADDAPTREAPVVFAEDHRSDKAAVPAETGAEPVIETESKPDPVTETDVKVRSDAADVSPKKPADDDGYDWKPLVLHPEKGQTNLSSYEISSIPPARKTPASVPTPAPVTRIAEDTRAPQNDGTWKSIPVSRETIRPSAPTPMPQPAPTPAVKPLPSAATREAETVRAAAEPSPMPKREAVVKQESAAKQQAEPAPSISLDDFNKDAGSVTSITDMKKKKKRSFRGSAGFGVIKLVLYLAFVAVCVWVLSSLIWNVANDIFAFVKSDEDVVVFIPEGATTEDIADILKEANVIRYPKVFTAYAKFRISRRDYLTGTYLSGMHTVNPMHNFDTLIEELSNYEHSVTGTVRITIPEGLTVNETLKLLEENGVCKKADCLEALQNFEYEYRFAGMLGRGMIADCRFDTNVSYRLEGYLFPDTYEFYLGENPVSVLDRFLVNFDKKFEEDFYNRCEALGMTVDQVITLASLIEKEGNNANDYYLISSVFHNRLKHSGEFPYLNSDAALQYAAGEHMELDEINTSADTPYNTYTNRGLPPGPICNPSLEAIYAALYPEDTNYYYFYTKKSGETVYSRNINEHNNVVAADKAN